ncbi:transcriptional regulator GutM [Erwinia sp. ACCC 02193]|jgi:glucitol operon activator protein|uniref:Transcriptional regulator GutM n=1 Tax=Erwinia aeris TaxID=3239803 RepID=A0ABV4E3F9_9GAMM
MDPVNSLICVAALAWTTQIVLGWLQINRFNRALALLSECGRVRIGRSAGRFKPRVVLALAIGDEGRITGNFVIKGLTVFANPYSEERLTGAMLDDIRPEVIFPANKSLQEALALAISNKR